MNEDFLIDYDDDGNMILLEYTGNEKTVTVPEGIVAFEEEQDLFIDNTTVEKVILPDSLVYLATYSFCGCTSLKEVVLPAGLREINMSAFEGCTSLEKINFPARLKRIGPSAFKNCPKLKDFEIPSKLIEIQKDSFDDTTAVLSKNPAYEIQDNIMYCKTTEAALYCTDKSMTELRVRKGTKTIGWNCFSFCNNLKTVSLPNGLTEIGRGAFLFCPQIEEIRFPAGLRNIQSGAFANCSNLKFIKFKGDDSVSVGKIAFCGCDNLKEITLPKASDVDPGAFDAECKVLFFK